MKERVQVSKMAKSILKKAFPAIKFSVRTPHYNCVRVSWGNGPTVEAVESLVNQFEAGHFDGMTDCYEYSNRRDDIPQVGYLFCDREIDADIYQKAFDMTKDYFSFFEGCQSLNDKMTQSYGTAWTPREFLGKIISKVDLSKPLDLETIRKAYIY